MKRTLTSVILVLALSVAGVAPAQDCAVTKYETQSYSQSAHIVRDRVVYTLETRDGLTIS